MNCLVEKIASKILLLLVALSLSGCATKQLSNDIKAYENGQKLYSNDVISAAAATKSENGNYNWVFVGNRFDYALNSGANDFLRALIGGNIDKSRIEVSQDGKFVLDKARQKFSGHIVLKYRYLDNEEKAKITNILRLPASHCHNMKDESGVCEIELTDLVGTIHQKAKTPDNAFRLNHPIKVRFYVDNSLSAKRILYPVAVATDVAMSPLYLLGGVAVLSVFGLIMLH